MARRSGWSVSVLPALFDRGSMAFDCHYVLQAAWASRRIAEAASDTHIDVSSDIRVVSTLSAFIPVVYAEYRPVHLRLAGLLQVTASLQALPFGDRSVRSISCMHVIEHVGLGRYGDALSATDHQAACQELSRVVAQDGTLLISLPVGRKRVMFNAHRVSDPVEVVSWFPGLRLREFSVITDAGELKWEVDPACYRHQDYACGLYRFSR